MFNGTVLINVWISGLKKCVKHTNTLKCIYNTCKVLFQLHYMTSQEQSDRPTKKQSDSYNYTPFNLCLQGIKNHKW